MGGNYGRDDAGRDDPPPLDGFSERLERMRSDHAPPPPQKGSAFAWGRAMRVASDLFAGLLVGGLLGFGLDRWLGTSPWFLLAGFGIGFAAGLRNMARTLKEDSDDKAEG
ncbi:MAG: AtpZ/AtpI family protein [Pseudomonadota bacterium]